MSEIDVGTSDGRRAGETIEKICKDATSKEKVCKALRDGVEAASGVTVKTNSVDVELSPTVDVEKGEYGIAISVTCRNKGGRQTDCMSVLIDKIGSMFEQEFRREAFPIDFTSAIAGREAERLAILEGELANGSIEFSISLARSLFWLDSRDGKLHQGRVRADGLLATHSFVDSDPQMRWFTTLGADFFWYDTRDNAIHQGVINRTGELQTTAIVDREPTSLFMTSDGLYLYWLDSRDGKLHQGEVRNNQLSTTAIVDHAPSYKWIVGTSYYLYWVDSRDGKLHQGRINQRRELRTIAIIDVEPSMKWFATDGISLYWLDTRDNKVHMGNVRDGILRTQSIVDHEPTSIWMVGQLNIHSVVNKNATSSKNAGIPWSKPIDLRTRDELA